MLPMSQHNHHSDWVAALADKVRQAQHPVGDEVWLQVSRQLPRSRRRIWVWWTLGGVAAAAAIVVAVLSLYSPVNQFPAQPPMIVAETTQEPSSDALPMSTTAPTPIQTVGSDAPSDPSIVGRAMPVDTMLFAQSVPLPTAVANGASQQDNDELSDASPTDKMQQEPLSVQQPPQQLQHPTVELVRPKTHGCSASSLSMSLYGSGNMLAQNRVRGAAPGQQPLMLMAVGDGRFVVTPQAKEYTYKHRMPLNVGVMFSKSLPYGLSLGAGVNYAYYSSEVTAGQERFDQTVQFLGVPVALQWRFWQCRHLSARLGVEAMAERCVSARFGNDDTSSPRRLLWSLHGMASLHYDLTDHVGLFVEPQISHYLTEFPMMTIRNEHPVNFNLKLGVDVNF